LRPVAAFVRISHQHQNWVFDGFRLLEQLR
jgi:hypothetical protein